MIKKHLILLLLLFVSINSFSQQKPLLIIDKTGNVHPWSNLEINNNPENFQFAIVADRTGGHRPGVFLDGVKKLNLLQPEFVMSVGDLIEGYTRDADEINRQWDEFNEMISLLKMPFFYVPGNHDYINDVMAEIWEEKYGRSYYHFIYHNVLFLCMNSEEATKGSNMGGIEQEQFEYISEVLAENPDVRWTMLFMHQPLWVLDNTRYWNDVEKLLTDRKHTVIAGHHHHYVKYERNNGKYIMLATTGGASGLRGPDLGEFDHVVWVTMTDEGPVIANLLLEGVWDENIVNERIAALTASRPVKFNPLIFEDEFFSQGEVQYKITNDENIPLHYTITIPEHPVLMTDSQKFEGTVPPNNVVTGNLKLRSETNTRMGDIQPLILNTEFIYSLENGRDISMSQDYRIAPVNYHSLVKASSPKKIDGKLNDWKDLPFEGDSKIWNTTNPAYTGNDDCSYSFGVEYDKEFVYLGIAVEDDEVMLDPQATTWRQDALWVHIDPRTAVISAGETNQESFSDFEGIIISPAAGKKHEMVVYQKDRLPEGVKMATSTSDNKIYYEIAVPVVWLNKINGSDWKNLRINIGINDADMNGSVIRLWWKPEWRSADNYIGSGLFRVEDIQ